MTLREIVAKIDKQIEELTGNEEEWAVLIREDMIIAREVLLLIVGDPTNFGFAKED